MTGKQPKSTLAIVLFALAGLVIIGFGMFQVSRLVQVRIIGPYRAAPYDQRAYDAMSKSNWDGAIAELTDAIKANPDDAWAYTMRGDCYGNKGEVDKAVADLNEAVRLSPGDPSSWHYRGIAYALKHDWDKAVADYTKAIDLGEDDTSIYINRGMANNARERWDDAIRDFDKAIMIDSTVGSTFAYRGYSYSRKGNFEKSMEDFSEAIRLDPNDVTSFATRGSSYFEHGDYAKAFDDLREALSLEPNNPEALNDIAWCLAICPDQSFRNSKQAVEYATKSCEFTKWKEGRTIDTLAAACADAGDFDQAVKYEKQAMTMPDMSDKDRAEAQERVDLYQQQKPYREQPKNK